MWTADLGSGALARVSVRFGPAFLLTLAACSSAATDDPLLVRSEVVRHEGHLPPKYTCDGENVSPPLEWSGLPHDAFEVAVVVTDPDAPGGDFVHWTMWGMDPALGGIAEGEVPAQAKQGTNGFGDIGWGGPCPPKGQTHRYVFTVFAVRAELPVEQGAAARGVLTAIEDRLAARGGLVANYGRF